MINIAKLGAEKMYPARVYAILIQTSKKFECKDWYAEYNKALTDHSNGDDEESDDNNAGDSYVDFGKGADDDEFTSLSGESSGDELTELSSTFNNNKNNNNAGQSFQPGKREEQSPRDDLYDTDTDTEGNAFAVIMGNKRRKSISNVIHHAAATHASSSRGVSLPQLQMFTNPHDNIGEWESVPANSTLPQISLGRGKSFDPRYKNPSRECDQFWFEKQIKGNDLFPWPNQSQAYSASQLDDHTDYVVGNKNRSGLIYEANQYSPLPNPYILNLHTREHRITKTHQ